MLAPADRTLLVTVLEPLDASLVTGVSGFGTGVLSPEQFDEADDSRRTAAGEILEQTVTALALTGVEARIIEGDPGRALCDLASEVEATGDRPRHAWPWRLAAGRARLGLRSRRAQRAVLGADHDLTPDRLRPMSSPDAPVSKRHGSAPASALMDGDERTPARSSGASCRRASTTGW